jgi:hypothetical protein
MATRTNNHVRVAGSMRKRNGAQRKRNGENEMARFLLHSRLTYSRVEFEEDESSKYLDIGTNGN